MKKILLIGATSAIAEATARIWANEGNRLYLIARREERLQAMVSDLKIRGALSCGYGLLDVNDFDQHEAVIDESIKSMGGVDIVLIAHGTLGDQKICENDFGVTLKELNTNAISVISLLTHLANRFEKQRYGSIVVISSVAGDRGRQSNYVYGTAKGAVSIFLQGLRQRLFKSGVHVLTVKPGFVDTPMTKDFKKGLLWVGPDRLAKIIARSVVARRQEVYAPWFWAIIMFIIKNIPENIFRRMKL